MHSLRQALVAQQVQAAVAHGREQIGVALRTLFLSQAGKDIAHHVTALFLVAQ